MFHRVNHEKNYTCIDNGFLRDEKLSLRARGLMATILQLPDSWNFSIDGLEAILPNGRTAVRNAVKELEKAGYIVRLPQQRGEDGRMQFREWEIIERPALGGSNAQGQQSGEDLGDVAKGQFGTVGGFSACGKRTELNTKD